MSEAQNRSVAEVECYNNHSTRDSWACYAGHRERVTALIRDGLEAVGDNGRGKGASLCVLGAGNCNDLDLPRLVERFDCITLADLDDHAVRGAVLQQLPLGASYPQKDQLRVVGPIDLSGVADLLRPDSFRLIDTTRLEQLAGAVKQRLATTSAMVPTSNPRNGSIAPTSVQQLLPEHDVVASCCLLSQLIRQVNDCFRKNSNAGRTVSYQVVAGHLQLLLRLTRPGGNARLITDFASSADGAPEITTVSNAMDLEELSEELVNSGRHYEHLASGMLVNTLTKGALGQLVQSVNPQPVWVWPIRPQQQYLCYALEIRRSMIPWEEVMESSEGRLAARLRRFSAETKMAVRDWGV